jgi:hypothetical protein
MMGPITQQLEFQRIREAKRLIGDSKEAILGFMLRNKRLPCPARPNLAEGDIGAGKEDCSFFTNPVNSTAYGVLPWIDLGLPQLDPWGRRLRYAVTMSFADSTPPLAMNFPPPLPTIPPDPAALLCSSPVPLSSASFSWCMTGDKQVSGVGGALVLGKGSIASDVVLIVLSHGKNGLGGYASDGAPLAGAVGDELENANANNVFISATMSDTPVFDDLIDWIAPPIIFNKMVNANLLP